MFGSYQRQIAEHALKRHTDKAADAGAMAQLAGYAIDANPYSAKSHEHHAWRRGWTSAKWLTDIGAH